MGVTVSALAFVNDEGHLSLDHRQEFRESIKALSGHEVVVSVKPRPKRQGDQQLRYLRGVVIPDLAHACGYTDPDEYQDVFEGMAWKFLRLPDGPFGEPRRQSTSKRLMSQADLAAFIDRVITYAETTIPGCRIRRPEDVDLADIYDPEWR